MIDFSQRAPKILVAGYFKEDNFGDNLSFKVLESQISKIYLGAQVNKLRSEKNIKDIFLDFKSIFESQVVVFGSGNIFQSHSSSKSFWYYAAVLFLSRILLKPCVALCQGVGPLSFFQKIALDIIAYKMVWCSRDSTCPSWVKKINVCDFLELEYENINCEYSPQGEVLNCFGIKSYNFNNKKILKVFTDRFHVALLMKRKNIPCILSKPGNIKFDRYNNFHKEEKVSLYKKKAKKNLKVLKFFLRWQTPPKPPQGGVLNSFNGLTFLYMDNNPFKICLGFIDGISAKVLPRFWFQNRQRGVDLVDKILRENKNEVCIWGTKNFILEKFPEIKNKFSGFEEETSQIKIRERILSLNPKIILLALSSPRQDMEAKYFEEMLPNSLILPCGGSLDAISKENILVPKILYLLGLEWFLRMCVQPTRLKRLPKIFKGFFRSLKITSSF